MRDNVADGDIVNMEGTSECLSAEALTLIMEGKGRRKARKAWMNHLDGCEDCRTVLAEAAAYVEDSNQRFGEERTPSWLEAFRAGIGRFQSFAPMLTVVLVVALVVPFAVVQIAEQFGNGPRISVAALSEALVIDGSTRYSENLWRDDSSGASFATALTEEQIEFRLGIHLVDLRVAIREENREAAGKSLRELEDLVSFTDSPASVLVALRESLDSGDFEAATRRKDDIESELAEGESGFFFRFGGWAEASRLAADGGRAGFFRTDAFRAPLQEIRSEVLEAPVSTRLQEIERLVSPENGELELSTLGRELRRLMLLF